MCGSPQSSMAVRRGRSTNLLASEYEGFTLAARVAFLSSRQQTLRRNLGGDILQVAYRCQWLWLGHILRMDTFRLVQLGFDLCSANSGHPPYTADNLLHLVPWPLAEAIQRAQDRTSWVIAFDTVYLYRSL